MGVGCSQDYPRVIIKSSKIWPSPTKRSGYEPVLLVYVMTVYFLSSFDSSIGGLTFSDQFLQIGTYLDSDNIYGFGEQEHHSLKHSTEWQQFGMWARDQAVTVSWNSYLVSSYLFF